MPPAEALSAKASRSNLLELYIPGTSLLHRADARVKVLITLAFIVTLNLLPAGAWAAYILFLAAALSAALVSRLGMRNFLRRSLVALPFIFAAAPLIFLGPEPRLPLPLLAGGTGWVYSPAGLLRFAAITLRAWISLQAAVLLAASTPFPALLVALRQLGLPAVLTSVIGLMWRYLSVITAEARCLLQARLSRSPRAVGSRSGGSLWWRASVTGGMAGSLFLRSLERSDRIYEAMLARGYNGEPPGLHARPLRQPDILALAAAGAILLLLWLFGLLTGR